MLEDNTRAAVNVMTTAHRLGARRVILAGSVEEPRGATEAPCSPYAAAKLAATSYARLFHQQWELPVTVLRPTMVYGPSQPDQTKLIPFVIGRMLDGQAPELSSGTRPIDWVYVDDVCRAFLAAATHPAAPGLVADIGSGTSTTIADTVNIHQPARAGQARRALPPRGLQRRAPRPLAALGTRTPRAAHRGVARGVGRSARQPGARRPV